MGLKLQRLAFITPSLSSGGAERVMSELVNYFAANEMAEVHLVILTGKERFYALNDKIQVHEPSFDYKKYSRIAFTFKIMRFLRGTLKKTNPDAVLSFGGRYNSFVLLSVLGLGLRIFVSDRSRPGISYGRFLDRLNPIMYRFSAGIVAQTERAKDVLFTKTRHANIQVIPNPIRQIHVNDKPRENVILNVGRFIPSKHQDVMVEMFAKVAKPGWKLFFLGNGPELDRVRQKIAELPSGLQVECKGNVKNVDDYFRNSAIFAFTSSSEGFPNALGEAMSAGLACISFNCEAGPSDLIDDGLNGFLVPLFDKKMYEKRLKELIESEELRIKMGKAAQRKMQKFKTSDIASKYYNFLVN